MPESIKDYFQELLDQISASQVVDTSNLQFDMRSSMIGFVRGQIYFLGGSVLHVRELVDLRSAPERIMYVYHYQSRVGELIFRYDNSTHYPGLPSFPDHKHVGNEIRVISDPPDLPGVLAEIATLIAPPAVEG